METSQLRLRNLDRENSRPVGGPPTEVGYMGTLVLRLSIFAVPPRELHLARHNKSATKPVLLLFIDWES